MKPEFIYLDCIPQLTAQEAGVFSGAGARRRLLALAVTWDAVKGFQSFDAKSAGELVKYLKSGKCVVGYNLINFDYQLIKGHVQFRRPNTCDLFLEIIQACGERVSAANVINETLGLADFPDGNTATELCKRGKLPEVIKSQQKKLMMFQQLHEHILKEVQFSYMSRRTEGLLLPRNCSRPDSFEASAARARPAPEQGRGRMIDQATALFTQTGKTFRLVTMENLCTGECSVSTTPDCENGMQVVVGRVR